jgi:ABC-2 type transport system permease protein
MSVFEAIYGIWLREFKVFRREKSRVITSLFTPLLWIFGFGGGLGPNVSIKDVNYQVFIYPGILTMSILFTSVFFGVYIVWDRKIDILKEILVAPIPRTAIFVGKMLGGITDSMIQGTIMLLIGVALGISFTPTATLLALLFLLVLAIGLVSLGLTLGSILTSPESFGTIVSFLVFPLFFFSGALYPLENLPPWLMLLTYLDPVTYGVDGIRGVLLGTSRFPLLVDFLILVAFAFVMIEIGTVLFKRMQ